MIHHHLRTLNLQPYGEDDDDDDELEILVEKPIETAEAWCGKSNKMLYKIWVYLAPEQLFKEWTSPIYVFFQPTPAIVTIDEQRVGIGTGNPGVTQGQPVPLP